ncbi:hypothetical protein, partial [Neisseria sp. P0024.S006]|uniref:hypothetical protein n=1 Tax=Neisseria sp. P0024.S006 TaxID=3436850 RepID=UPI003F80B117
VCVVLLGWVVFFVGVRFVGAWVLFRLLVSGLGALGGRCLLVFVVSFFGVELRPFEVVFGWSGGWVCFFLLFFVWVWCGWVCGGGFCWFVFVWVGWFVVVVFWVWWFFVVGGWCWGLGWGCGGGWGVWLLWLGGWGVWCWGLWVWGGFCVLWCVCGLGVVCVVVG